MTEKVVVHNLKKSFHHLDVLKGIDLTVAEGEVVCVIGPSGGGKSTFLRCLNRTSAWCFKALISSPI